MSKLPRNLDGFERALSAVLGLSLSLLALRGSTTATARVFSGALGAGLLIRAGTGRCAVKAALSGRRARPETIAEPPELSAASAHSARMDETLEGTFPASDPPASHFPDEPPSNAEDKWAAARAAEKAGSKH